MLGRSSAQKLLPRFYSSEPPFMTIVREGLKVAMRLGDTTTKNTLRDVMSSVKNANIQKPDSCKSDINLHGLLKSLIDTRTKSAQEYQQAGRKELADNEHSEIKILEELASKIKVASVEEIEEKIKNLMEKLELPEQANQKLGKVMSEIKKLDIEKDWNASQKQVVQSVQRILGVRKFSTMRAYSHQNPLGIPRRKPAGSAAASGPRAIPDVAKVILVSSAKGGVGKSTVAVNLAQALFQQGHATGILDADIFGPSIPSLLQINSEPRIKEGKLLPLANYGLKAMSMGFLVPPDKAVAWRGLLIQKALNQLLFEVDWGHLDYLVVDMPPGTGDVQLTIAQQLKVDGAIVVSTPQDIALVDAVRGIDMFKSVQIPILGMVQNMSLFVCPNCKYETHIFGKDGAFQEAEKRGIRVLESIPLSVDISNGGEAGSPVVLQEGNPCAKFYTKLAEKVTQTLAIT